MNFRGKRLLPLLTATILVVFLFVRPVFAKSGCCSSHGGVCCGCGAQSNGKVICNDGWRGSSCYYSEMVMCGGSSGGSGQTSPPTSTPVPVYIPPTEAPTLAPIAAPTAISTVRSTNTPAPTSTPTLRPTSIPSPANTATDKPIEKPESAPEVKGITSQEDPIPTAGVIGTIGTMGALSWVGYKLLKKFLSKKS